jgi:NADH-quinone oxidoreductase subunit F
MDYESMQGLKTMLGSGAVMPFNSDRDPVKLLHTLTRFYAHESCGQCTPCREGTGYANRVLTRVVKGEGEPGDVDLVYDLADNFEWTTICPLATADAWPIKSFIPKFREQFDKYLEGRTAKTSEEEAAAAFPGAFM